MSARKSSWVCGFCSAGNHERCSGGFWTTKLREGFDPVRTLTICACRDHDIRERCLACGNIDAEDLMHTPVPKGDGFELVCQWKCADPADCQNRVLARQAANPLHHMIAASRQQGGAARAANIHARTVALIRDSEPKGVIPGETGTWCRCEGTHEKCTEKPVPTRGGRFAPGHDASLKGHLTRLAKSGDEAALARLIAMGWPTPKEKANA